MTKAEIVLCLRRALRTDDGFAALLCMVAAVIAGLACLATLLFAPLASAAVTVPFPFRAP